MSIELAIAAVCCFLLTVGHTAIGARWVLPGITRESLPRTPFGSRAMTLNVIRFTWNVVSLFQFACGVLLAILALSSPADVDSLVLRWQAGFWVAAMLMLLWEVRRRPTSFLRLPVPLLLVVIAAMCWAASG